MQKTMIPTKQSMFSSFLRLPVVVRKLIVIGCLLCRSLHTHLVDRTNAKPNRICVIYYAMHAHALSLF